ncbi:hypothetical protein [Sphingomonas sp. KC8]|uniref:hypothetical protein n=1 Tax=Sphingomonas sp. KC8 TaxID=1030157 RepID=UPI000248A437|nr:hypothetical protein [Sphingomonas sp. KC8]ARS27612.1 hypothetical protein KC8_09940 [Sphingomonas sp. KC8]
MADPITIGIMALQAAGPIMQGQADYKAGMANARAADANAQQAEVSGVMEEAEIRRRSRMAQGDAISEMGAGGIQLGTGTALEVLRESAINAEFDVLASRYTSSSQARAYRADASASRSAAKSARIGGFLRAGAAVLSGSSAMGNASKLAGASAASRGSSLQMPLPVGSTSAGNFGTVGSTRIGYGTIR